jgi:beta-glucosidase/6-phospho-beta-glucosidase/beta-galactosidase/ABC-type amino acid transport substrate-binding protein
LFNKGSHPPLPDSFIFGVATADHQCEAFNSKCVDIRDWWEGMRDPKTARGKATDFWHRYEEDIDIAEKLGCSAFRFSIAWSRIEPEPGQFNQEAIEHYRKLIDKIISCHMKPVLTLHHFTWPVHVQERGGMTAEGFPDIFANYVSEVARHFAKDVPYWITFNEPNLLMGGYLKPWWDEYYAAPPGLPADTTTAEQVDEVGKLIRNLFLSHKRAYEIIKAENPHALVGANQYFFGLPLWLQKLVNRNASVIKGDKDLQKQADRLALKRDMIRGDRISRLRANISDKNKPDVVLAALTRTPEREEQVAFSDDYFITRQQLLVESGSSVANVQDLTGEIVVVKGTTAEKNLPLLFKDSRSIVLDDYLKALRYLDQKGNVALLSDSTILSGLMEQHPGKYRIIELKPTGSEKYAAAIAKGDSGLLKVVNSVIRDFNVSAETALWRDKYEKITGLAVEKPLRSSRRLAFGESSPKASAARHEEAKEPIPEEPIPRAPTGTALRRIQDRGHLVAAVREDLPGFGYRNPETGDLEGLEIELAHALAGRIFGNSEKVQLKQVAIQKRMTAVEPVPNLFDWIFRQYTILSTIMLTNWWYMGMGDELEEYLCPHGCEKKMDFVGLDYYWGISSLHIERIQRLIDASYKHFDQAPVWPGALYDILKDLSQKFPNHPIIICENGSVKVADGWERVKYIREHVLQVQRSIKDGMKVEAYLYWAITSNREWDLEFNDASDFGLYNIDLDHDPALTRKRTPGADAYEQIIKDRRG